MSSWIDRALQSAEIRRLHAAVLQAGPELRGRAGALPALTPDAEADTYWDRRPTGVPVHHLPACSSPEGLADGLAAFWLERGQPELAALAPALAALAAHLKSTDELSAELPHLVYTLF